MFNILSVVIVCFALGLSLFIGIFALFRNQSYKKNYFLLMQTMVIVYLLGYLFELTSTNAEEAYTAVKVLYIGAYFIPVFAFFFLADYCSFKLHPVFVKAPMVIISLAFIITMWTTKFHHLLYQNYYLDLGFAHGLRFTPGPYYSLIHTYPMICLLVTMGMLLYQLKKWANKYRKQLLILFVCLAIPFVAEGIYYITLLTGLTTRQIYLTPHSMAIMSFCLYLAFMRFNIFEIISVGTLSAMEHIREGFVLLDENYNYLSSNHVAERIIPGIVKLSKGESVFSAEDWPKELRNMENETVEFSITNGGVKYFEASISPVVTGNEVLKAKIVLLREITDNINLMKRLESAAYLDALTGLYNRKHFTELANVDIERALRTNQSIYSAMLDLDFFKNVNDTYGHAAGDLVLKVSAGIIRQTIRFYDLLGRYGGEEFVLMITDLDPSEAYKLMERIRENIEHSITLYEGVEIKITCSIGLAQFQESDTLESAVKKADEALYAAKNSGRNLVKIYGSF